MWITMSQHKRVFTVIWLCHLIIPLALHALHGFLGHQASTECTHLLSELRFVIRECAFVQHLRD